MAKFKKILFAASLAIAACFLISGPAWAEKKVALVIGNGAYGRFAKLDNPGRDATAMAALLSKFGFVASTARTDIGLAELKRALADFEVEAEDADIAVIYFSGHGLQIGGEDYIVPVDAALARDIDVPDETVSVERVERAVSNARRLGLVVLDACRDNPFLAQMKRTAAMRSVGRGLAPVAATASNNILVAFSAAPGEQASDGETGGHSPFTAALLNRLATPGLDVQLALRQVRDDVDNATDHQQKPYMTGSLGGGVIALAPSAGENPAPVTPATSAPSPTPTPLPSTSLTDQALCKTSLNGRQDNWEEGAAVASAVAEAKKRGLTVEMCRLELGVALADPHRSSKPALIAKYGDWSVYCAPFGSGKTCYAITSAKLQSPVGNGRQTSYLMVSNRSSDRVVNEVSLLLGADPKTGVPAMLSYGSQKYALIASKVGLFVRNAREESELVRSLGVSSSQLELTATTASGVAVRDSFSPIGAPDAINRAFLAIAQ